LERGSLGNVRRAAAFYKLQRYSYNGSGDSYGVGSCDIRRFFRDLWECSHRLKDAVLENKDFESIITARNDPQTVVYCDPPYYEAECYTVEFPRSDHQRLHDVLVKHTGFAMVSYNNCPYIRELYDDFFIYEVERPNSQSKKKNNKYREYIMTNYDPRTFAPQMSFFGDYDSRGKSCRLVHTPQRPLKV
jgi:DNA adenine methylase